MSFSKKKKPIGFTPDSAIAGQIKTAAENNRLPCASAFNLSETLGLSRAVMGDYADHLGIRLEKCQIGLFGYGNEKKQIVKLETLDETLSNKVDELSESGSLSCEAVFLIASELNVSKVDVGCVCETKGIKIKPCQLGAF